MAGKYDGVLKTREGMPPEPESQAARKPGRPPGRRSDVKFVQTTAYIERDIHKRTMFHLAANRYLSDTAEDYSSLVNRLLAEWNAKQKNVTN